VFDASHPFTFFEYFRIPYGQSQPPSGRAADTSPDPARAQPSGHHGPAAAPDPALTQPPGGHGPASPGLANGPELPPGLGRLRATAPAGAPARSLYWLRAESSLADPAGTAPAGTAPAGTTPAGTAPASTVPGRLGRYRLRDSTIIGHVVPDGTAPGMLRRLGPGWRRAEPLVDPDGQRVASIWRDPDGNVFLPFDPGEVMRRFWSERYQGVGRSPTAALARTAVLRGYYLVRPLLPRPLQLRMRRAFTKVQNRSTFPAWPVEDGLHDLYQWLFTLVAELAGQPVPFLNLWPDGRSWAMVLTHDVETDVGYADISRLRTIESDRGYRSSWNFVALRYPVGDDVVRELQDAGFEVGVHGLRHDGRDLASQQLMEQRRPQMRRYAQRWNAVGFRSPATQRAWALMPQLGFEYDSSYTDTDPYEPQPGGCCTYLPYLNEDMVELPITMPQDHTMFVILQHADGDVWLRKARHIRERQGMVLVLTHPDYAHEDQRIAGGYRALLEEFRGDETLWHALPREVAAWWRDRAASSLRRQGDDWVIEGPASARGTVGLATPTPAPATSAAPATPIGQRLSESPQPHRRASSAEHRGHVLVVVENLPLGIDQRVRKQVKELWEGGFRVSVVTRKAPENDQYRRLPGFRVLEYPAPAEAQSMSGYAREYALSFGWAVLRCVMARLRGRIDVVQFCLPPDVYFPIAWLMRGLGAVVVTDHRDLMPEVFSARYANPRPAMISALRWLQRRTEHAADHTICTNNYFREQLIASGAQPDKVTIITNGPVLERIERAVADPSLRGEHQYMCCWIGMMGRQDRVDLLLDAIDHVVHGLGRTDCGFFIIGDGECRDELDAQTARLGLEPWVHFPGWMSEEQVFSYLATADIGLDTSLQEDISPVKIFEYMATGLPFVAFDVLETRVMGEGAAALVPPGDVKAYARELGELLDDRERRARLGAVGRGRVETELSWERQADTYLELMRRLCRPGRTRSAARSARASKTPR
jgi:glycosyltransferase involved in cell wall biosynthesis